MGAIAFLHLYGVIFLGLGEDEEEVLDREDDVARALHSLEVSG